MKCNDCKLVELLLKEANEQEVVLICPKCKKETITPINDKQES